MGRSKLPVILDDADNPFFSGDYTFEYGKIDVIRQGTDATIMTYGGMLARAIKACDVLKDKGFSVQLLNVSCPKDLDDQALVQAAREGDVCINFKKASTT